MTPHSMTHRLLSPPLAPQPDTAAGTQTGTTHLTEQAHLTEEQFGELFATNAAPATPATALANAHLLSCAQCAAEFASLRESLSHFRQASNAYACNELRRQPPITLPDRPMFSPALEPAYLAAAVAILLAAFLPMQALRRAALQPAPSMVSGITDRSAQSDEALLEDINREISASVPTPMQALADPTADTDTPIQNSPQRKD